MAENVIPKKKYLSVIFSQFKKKCVDVNSRIYVPKACVYTSYYDSGDSTYCQAVYKSGRFGGSYRISFGGNMVRQCVGLPDTDVPMSVGKAKFGECVKAFKGFYYHEIGHLRYTAITSPKFELYPNQDEVAALHGLFNILEDIVIERYCMSHDYPYTKKYFEYIEKSIFNDDLLQKYTDNDDAGSLFNFILYKLRRGPAFVGTNKIFDAHETDMLAHIKTVLSTRNANERIDKTIEFFEYLKSLGLDMTNPGDFTQSSSNIVMGKNGGGKNSSVQESSATPSNVGQSTSNSFSHQNSGGGNNSQSGSSGAPDPDGEDDGSSAGGRNHMNYDPTEDAPVDENSCYESFNQHLFSDDTVHSFYDMSYFTINNKAALMSSLEAMMSMVNPQANQIATVIKTYQSRNRLRYHAGKSSGKLHVPSAISGKPVNIFKKKEQLGLMPDLAISVLVDNSGSMGGLKSEIATRSMLSLAVACSKCSIPLEINAFSLGHICGYGSDYDCQTYCIKRFKDSFDKSKPYFGIVSSELNDYYDTECSCFASNYDEVNLYNVWREYRKQPWRDKVLIVISDGYTCGSSEDLRNVIKAAEADGIYVLGIGMCTDCVCNLYSNSKAFMSMSDIEQLPAFLGSTLTSLIKR